MAMGIEGNGKGFQVVARLVDHGDKGTRRPGRVEDDGEDAVDKADAAQTAGDCLNTPAPQGKKAGSAKQLKQQALFT